LVGCPVIDNGAIVSDLVARNGKFVTFTLSLG